MVDDDTAGIGKANKDVEMETDETDCQIPRVCWAARSRTVTLPLSPTK